MFGNLKRARRQLADANAVIRRQGEELDRLDQELTDAHTRLQRVLGERGDAWQKLAVKAGAEGEVDPSGPAGPRSLRGELLHERARADELARLVGVLQEANLRAQCEHGIPLVEGVSTV